MLRTLPRWSYSWCVAKISGTVTSQWEKTRRDVISLLVIADSGFNHSPDLPSLNVQLLRYLEPDSYRTSSRNPIALPARANTHEFAGRHRLAFVIVRFEAHAPLPRVHSDPRSFGLMSFMSPGP